MRILLLPGMDGTGQLFRWLIEALPSYHAGLPIAYDPHRPLGYDELVVQVRARLHASDQPTLLVAESFSGPIAIRIATEPPPQLRGLLLAASFARSPVAPWLRPAVGRWLFSRPPPRWAVRRYLVGPDASPELVEATMSSIKRVDARVMAKRLREILAVDVTQELLGLHLPVRFLFADQDRLIKRRRAYPGMTISGGICLPAPHAVLQRSPQAAAALIDEFAHSVLD